MGYHNEVLSQPPANVLGKAVEDSLSDWALLPTWNTAVGS